MKEALVDVPVLLIFFTRPDTFRRVFEKVKEARPSKLFLACDGPRSDHPDDAEKIEECKKIAEDIDWQCEVYIDYAEENMGCGMRPQTAISWSLSIVDRIIILEDDCIPEVSFFHYMSELLEKYKDDSRIGMISGLNHFKEWDCGGNSYCFTKTGAIWGWGTWRRVWQMYDYSVRGIESLYYQKLIYNEIQINKVAESRIKVWNETNRKVLSGQKISYWDHQIGFEKYAQSLLAIVPKYNQICNCGVGSESTHTQQIHDSDKWNLGMVHFIPTKKLELPLKHPELIICDREYDLKYFDISYPSILKKVYRKVKRYMRSFRAYTKYKQPKIMERDDNGDNG